ncbi:hypothetical protein [Yaniella flava]|uniref:hypothetical protein n=1 Tax=Yaniella flava TaxID=287930 RepID=UPI0031E413BC
MASTNTSKSTARVTSTEGDKGALRSPEIALACIMALVVAIAIIGGANVAGFIASTVAFVVWLPQARSVWASRNDPHALSSISVGTQVLLLSNAVLWGVYAAQESAFWVAAPGIINAPLALLCIGLIIRARKQQNTVQTVDCEHCHADRQHREFITAPAGWGSVMDCSGTPRDHAVVVFTDEDISALRSQRA